MKEELTHAGKAIATDDGTQQRKQQLRLQRFGMALSTYAVVTIFVSIPRLSSVIVFVRNAPANYIIRIIGKGIKKLIDSGLGLIC